MKESSRRPVLQLLERLSMPFTSNGKRQDEISLCQNTEKRGLVELLLCLLPKYIE